jgi:hypothetical protein
MTSRDSSPDRQRTTERYSQAAKHLNLAIAKVGDPQWTASESVLELDDDLSTFDAGELERKIDSMLVAHSAAIKDKNTVTKCKQILSGWFIALSPFAKNFLAIASQAQSVSLPP